MVRRKRPPAKASKAPSAAAIPVAPPTPADAVLVPGPKLRGMIGISAVTLWRWRHDKEAAFPAAKTINGRLYFPWADVQAWLARQQQAA
jgi:predicted DNA-binding transcriptional regulator AlpA